MSKKVTGADEHEIVEQPQKNNRRKLLKTAGVAGGALAASQWGKPALDSIILPAHAQTSDVVDDSPTDDSPTDDGPPPPTEKVLAGPTQAAPPSSAKVNSSIISNPNTQLTDVTAALINDDGADYQHCLTITIPATPAVPTSVNVKLDGPTIYYDYAQRAQNTTYYNASVNFSGSATANVTQNGNDFDFSTTINGLDIIGTIDQSLTSATGSIINNSGPDPLNIQGSAGYGAFMENANGGSGYGAYWDTNENSSCMVGTGPKTTDTIQVGTGPSTN